MKREKKSWLRRGEDGRVVQEAIFDEFSYVETSSIVTFGRRSKAANGG